MGLKYLDGRSWAEVTREERFFCLHLFTLIQRHGVAAFVEYLNEKHGASLDLKANWEIAYEVCFYRDLRHHRGGQGPLYSPKRTFDLCLLSDAAIVIIEAKAHQEFGEGQLDVFEKDKMRLVAETGVKIVLLAGLASSCYTLLSTTRACFNGPYLTWRELADLYDNDAILRRADAIYEPGAAWNGGQNNTGGLMTGEALLNDYDRGEEFFVGRRCGLQGAYLAEDIATGGWRRHMYETNRTVSVPPNGNWFQLSDFARLAKDSSVATGET